MFIVLTKTFFDPAAKNEVLELVRSSLPVFRKQIGIISIAAHISNDGTHTMTYILWENKEASDACMQSADFARLNPQWAGLFSAGLARFEYHGYTPLDTL